MLNDIRVTMLERVFGSVRHGWKVVEKNIYTRVRTVLGKITSPLDSINFK